MTAYGWAKLAVTFVVLAAVFGLARCAQTKWDAGQHALACSHAIEAPAGSRDLSRCSGKVRMAVRQAERDAATAANYEACARGLKPPAVAVSPSGAVRGWSVPGLCAQPIQDLAAAQVARAAEVASRDREIAALRANTAAARSRAAALAAANTRRANDATRTIERLPAGRDGRRRCDADCLRRLGSPPSG